jgi:hypothetical protein
MHTKFLSESLDGRNNFGDLGLDVKTQVVISWVVMPSSDAILKLILMN